MGVYHGLEGVPAWPHRVLGGRLCGLDARFLRALLEDGLDVPGEADNGRPAVEQVRDLQPDVVLLYLSMPQADGSSALRVAMSGQGGADAGARPARPARAPDGVGRSLTTGAALSSPDAVARLDEETRVAAVAARRALEGQR